MLKKMQNFGAGPAQLPFEALQSAREEIYNFRGTGLSVMCISHRSKEYTELHAETLDLLRRLLNLPENYNILLLHGGASLQFAMVPMNLLNPGNSADYIITGRWSLKAFNEAQTVGNARIAATTEQDGKFLRIPKQEALNLDSKAAYCHITSNNTVYGTQWRQFPGAAGVPLVADMSSDILSRQFDIAPFGLIYAGAQKNLGPAGVTAVIIREDIVEKCRAGLPTLLRYRTHVENNSLYSTPPCFAVYMMNKTLTWLQSRGGIEWAQEQSVLKAGLVYGTIDSAPEFFISSVEEESRSLMNAVFRLPTEELEEAFIAVASENGFVGLAGHRSLGGIRISMYNAVSVDSVRELTSFMRDFATKNG